MNILKNKLFWSIFSVLTFAILFFYSLPKPIDMDLKKIGNGQKAVVFVYDANLSVSNQQAAEMNRALENIGEDANFLIAKTGSPEGENFIKHFNARSSELLFFNGKGKLTDRHVALLTAEELIERLSGK